MSASVVPGTPASKELEHALDAAQEALFETIYRHLTGDRPAEQDHEHIWEHVATVTQTLAVLQAETPREICEQAFGFSPTTEEWERILARLRRAASGLPHNDS